MSVKTKAVVLRTAGTNCDQETARALRLAGADTSVVHINSLIAGSVNLKDFDLMVIPGGFSYGDDVAAGKILANELRFKLGDALNSFIERGRKVIGICNGFQVLVKTGFLPGGASELNATLTANDSGRFQCHWVRMKREKSACKWLNKTEERWDLPMAHGEGKFVTINGDTLKALEKNGQVVFRYEKINPNGSTHAIAGVCNEKGNVIGLMPHPERHVHRTQHPEWTRAVPRPGDPVGLQFFKAAVENS
jgi:phosphoribosylformylglycinamidine synthase